MAEMAESEREIPMEATLTRRGGKQPVLNEGFFYVDARSVNAYQFRKPLRSALWQHLYS